MSNVQNPREQLIEVVPNTHYGGCVIFKALQDFTIKLGAMNVQADVKRGDYYAKVFNRKYNHADIITDNDLNNIKQRIYIYENSPR